MYIFKPEPENDDVRHLNRNALNGYRNASTASETQPRADGFVVAMATTKLTPVQHPLACLSGWLASLVSTVLQQDVDRDRIKTPGT